MTSYPKARLPFALANQTMRATTVTALPAVSASPSWTKAWAGAAWSQKAQRSSAFGRIRAGGAIGRSHAGQSIEP